MYAHVTYTAQIQFPNQNFIGISHCPSSMVHDLPILFSLWIDNRNSTKEENKLRIDKAADGMRERSKFVSGTFSTRSVPVICKELPLGCATTRTLWLVIGCEKFCSFRLAKKHIGKAFHIQQSTDVLSGQVVENSRLFIGGCFYSIRMDGVGDAERSAITGTSPIQFTECMLNSCY
jgi:hypothetical protein